MVTVIPSDSSLFTRFLMIGLFILTFAWIALFFWSSIFGFFELLRKKKVPALPGRRKKRRCQPALPF